MLRLRSAQPPLGAAPLEACVQALCAVTAASEAAWAYAVRAGAYEGVVRCAEAYPDDEYMQAVLCVSVLSLGSRGSMATAQTWPGHSAAAARAGAVRAVAATARKHGTQSPRLLTVLSTTLLSMLSGDDVDWDAMRSSRVATSLAAGLAVALRGETEARCDPGCVLNTSMALSALAHDKQCAQEAARGGALLSLAAALRTRVSDLHDATMICSALQRVAAHAPAAALARAADAVFAALRLALSVQRDSSLLQHTAWHTFLVLLHDDVAAQSRAVASGLLGDAVRTMERSVASRGDEDAALAAEGACLVLDRLCDELDDSHAANRQAAGAAGAVPAIMAAMRAHGIAHSRVAIATCALLSPAWCT